MLLKFFQSSLENICTRASVFIKLQAVAHNFIKKEPLAQVFSAVNFAKYLRNSFSKNTFASCFCKYNCWVNWYLILGGCWVLTHGYQISVTKPRIIDLTMLFYLFFNFRSYHKSFIKISVKVQSILLTNLTTS